MPVPRLVFQLPQSQPERRQLLLDLVEAGRRVLASQQFGLGAAASSPTVNIQPLQRLRLQVTLQIGN
jgi:hypothetical protein